MCGTKYTCVLGGSLFTMSVWGGPLPFIVASRTECPNSDGHCLVKSRILDRGTAANILNSWRKVVKVTKSAL